MKNGQAEFFVTNLSCVKEMLKNYSINSEEFSEAYSSFCNTKYGGVLKKVAYTNPFPNPTVNVSFKEDKDEPS